MTDPRIPALLRLNERIQAENDQLKELVAYLRDALMPPNITPVEWGLTPAEDRVFRVLVSREVASDNAICSALCHDGTFDDSMTDKAVHVLVCKIRRKLKLYQIEVKTWHGHGYYLDRDVRTKFKSLLNTQVREAA